MGPKSQHRKHKITGQKHTGESKEKSQERFQAWFGNMLEGVQILDYDWRYQYLNESAEKHNRRPNEELLGRKYKDMWPGIEATYVFSMIERCMHERVACEFENRFVYPDGPVGWFVLSIQPIPEGVLILSFDITERVQAEKQAAQMKRLYATLSQVNQTIVRVKEPGDLYQSICDVAVQFGEFSLAWIGLLDEDSGDVKPVAANGLDVNQWPFPVVNIKTGLYQNGVISHALHNSTVVTSEDIQSDERTQSLHTLIQGYNFHSLAVVPFYMAGRTIGTLCLISPETGFFKSGDEIRLLEEMGLDISFALETMETDRIKRQWADAFEHCAHGIVIGDPVTNRIRTCNPAFAREQGGTIQEFTSMPLLDMYAPEDHERIIQLIAQSDHRGSAQFEANKIRKDGSTYPVQMDLVSVRDHGGNLLYRVATQQDISARKEAEQSLQESRERYKTLFENNPHPMWVYDLETLAFLMVNDAAVNHYGYSREEFLGMTLKDIRPEEDIPALLTHIEQEQARLQRSVGWRHRKKDGSIIDVEISSHSLQFENRAARLVIANDITARKRAEAERDKLAERLDLATRSAKMGIWDWDIRQNELVWDDQMYALYGLKPGEFGGAYEAWLQGLHPEDRAPSNEISAQAVRGEREYNTEFRVLWPDGSVHWLKADGQVFRETQGRPLRMVGVNYDITERKEAEAEVRDSQARLAGVIDSAMDAIISLDAKQRILLFNPAAEEMFGCPAAEALGQPLDRFIPARFRALHREHVRAFGLSKRTTRAMGTIGPLTCLRNNGEEFPAEITISQTEMAGQKIYTAFLRDATERVQAQQALQASEQRLKLFVEYAPAAIAMFDRDMHYIAASRRYLSDYRLPVESVVGRSHYEVFPEIPERWKEIHQRCLAGAIEKNEEDPFLRLDGSLDWIRWEIHPWYEKTGEIGGILLFSEVITESKQTKEAALESERQMQALVTSLDDIVFEFDEQGTYLNVWAADESLLAQPKAQMLGRRIEEILGEENGRPFTEAVKRVLAGGQPESLEYSLGVIGGQRWFVARLSPIHSLDDSVRTVSMLIRDITVRKQAEERLHASEERFRRYFELGLIGMAITSPTKGMLEVNDQMCAILGYERDELLRMSWAELTHPDDLGVDVEQFNRVLAGEIDGYSVDKRWIHKDGQVIHSMISVKCLRREDGSVDYFVALLQDVTERKRAEEALRQSETRFRSLIENSSDEISIVGLDGKLQYESPTVNPTLGYKVGEFLGHNIFQLIHPDDLERVQEQFARLAQDPSLHPREQFRLLHQNGNWLWVEAVGTNLLSEPSVGGIVINYHDITDRKQAEAALQQSEERHRQVSNLISDYVYSGVVLPDGATRTEWVSGAFEQMTGYTLEEINQLPVGFSTLVLPEDIEKVIKKTQVLLDKESAKIEYRIRRRDGEIRWFRDYMNFHPGERSKTGLKVTGAVQDITEQVRAEREIQERTEDLLIINTLNEAINRGEDIEGIIKAFARETRSALACNDVAIYLLSPDANYIEMQNSTLPRKATERIENLIGYPIPKIRIPIREDGYFKRIMENEQGLLISDPNLIQEWIQEFTETTFLPKIVRPIIRKMVPQIYKILNIGSTISIPLISSGRVIGILDMSSEGQFNEEDLRRIRSISYQVTAVIVRKQVEQQVQLQLRRMSALSEIDRSITSSLDMRLSLDILLSEMLSQLGIDAAAVLLLNETNLTLEYCAGKGFRTLAIRQTRLRLGDGLAGQVGLERKLVHVTNLPEVEDQFLRAHLFKEENFIEYLGIPLVAKGMLKGVLEVYHRASLYPDAEWFNYLETLGGQAAIAIDNAQLFENMQKSNLELIAAYDATIAGWSHAMDLRDKETEGHSQRVTELTMKLAEKIGISQQEQVQIRRGALLHDIGKLGIPDQILLKAEELTDQEWAIMRQHPVYAFNMLAPILYLQSALDIPYCHHEKWDGTGYPRGLQGEQIPLAARLFAVVDVWDALTSDRPYRKAWTKEKALKYIQEQTGHHFDPEVVKVFLETIASDESALFNGTEM